MLDEVTIEFEEDVALAKSVTAEAAEENGFDRTEADEIGLAASELARNALKFAGGGILRIRKLGGNGIEVACEDEGPGIPDVEQAMREGFSTSGSLGKGLSSVERIADEVEIETEPGKGTTVRIKKWL